MLCQFIVFFSSIHRLTKVMRKTFKPAARPTVAEIDLRALAFNYRQLRKKIPREVDLLAVVKADAYGHGAVPVSLTLEKLGADYLGVATSDEGVELRKGGVKTPILILGGIYGGEVDQIFRFRLTPVVFHGDRLHLLSKEAERRKKNVKVHLKIDTGMGRLGVSPDLWPAFLRELKRLPRIEIEGILSHFSMTDEECGYSEGQWRQFQKAVEIAKEQGVSWKYLHMSSSGTLMASPTYLGNLVRPGIMLYGSYPSSALRGVVKLKPVMTLKTHIHFLKSVPFGAKISYGGTFTTKRQSLIATLPIGYADGYSHQLSQCGEVLIRGLRAPVAGRVCMDFIMVDVSDIPNVKVGDEVVLIGRQGRERITTEEIAEKIHSIPYEVLCSIGRRVPRIYK